MSEAIIVLAATAAAVYLLYPLIRRGDGRTLLLTLLFLAASAAPAEVAESDPSIGLLLIALEARRDHLLVSEAMRVVNPGAPRELDLAITLPPGALYLTVHRGLDTPALGPDGFRDRLRLGRGVREVIYSYALPAGRSQAVIRAFPLRVQRMEVVARGRGAKLAASRGRMIETAAAHGGGLSRWEVRGLAADEVITITMDGLPVSRPWLPRAAAGALAVLLAGGLAARARRRAPAASR